MLPNEAANVNKDSTIAYPYFKLDNEQDSKRKSFVVKQETHQIVMNNFAPFATFLVFWINCHGGFYQTGGVDQGGASNTDVTSQKGR